MSKPHPATAPTAANSHTRKFRAAVGAVVQAAAATNNPDTIAEAGTLIVEAAESTDPGNAETLRYRARTELHLPV